LEECSDRGHPQIRAPQQEARSSGGLRDDLAELVCGLLADLGVDVMAEPFVSGCCGGEICSLCGAPAEHKIGETIFYDDPMPRRHNLTAYICHKHFREIMGPAADRFPGRASSISRADRSGGDA
jgi:hypothetical protein